MTRQSRSVVLASTLLLLGAACTDRTPIDTLAQAAGTGRIKIGFANEAPYAFRDPQTGRVTGEAPEVARHVLARLGIQEVEGIITEFSSLIPGLKAGRFDLIAAGMYITPARCTQVLFSEPTYCVREALLVHRGNPQALHSYADIVKQRAKLAVVAGAAELQHAQQGGVTDDLLHVFPDVPSAVEGLRGGIVDAFAGTALTVQDVLRKLPGEAVDVAEPFVPFAPTLDATAPTVGCGAFAFRTSDVGFRDRFDRELGALLRSEEHLSLVSPFGFGTHTAVGNHNRDALCAPSP